MKTLHFFFMFFCISSFAICQNYSVPKNYKFVILDDYSKYEPQIRETMGWLMDTSLGQDSKKRREANNFFIEWITGEPNVFIEIQPEIVNFLDSNPELLMPFMIGWAKYALDNEYSKDKIKGYTAGIESTVAFYRRNRGYLKQCNYIEKYEKLAEANKLEEDIKKKLKVISKKYKL